MKILREHSGAALIEFVIILVPFLVLLFASIEFGVAGYNKAMITNASREGARAGIVFDASQPPGHRISDGEIMQVVNDYCRDNMITFGASATPAVTIARVGDLPGDDLTITVTYTYGFLILPDLIPGFSPILNLAAESVMRME